MGKLWSLNERDSLLPNVENHLVPDSVHILIDLFLLEPGKRSWLSRRHKVELFEHATQRILLL